MRYFIRLGRAMCTQGGINGRERELEGSVCKHRTFPRRVCIMPIIYSIYTRHVDQPHHKTHYIHIQYEALIIIEYYIIKYI